MDAGARWHAPFAVFAAAFLAAAVALHPILEPDLFWHLASGRWILEHRAVERSDVFTYTLQGREWVNLQWLFDVLTTVAWRWGGPDALVLGKSAAWAGIASLLVVAGRAAGAGWGIASLTAALAVMAGAERTTERPEVVSYAALAAVLFVIERSRRSGSRRELAALPLLVALWANLHSLAFLGAATILLHAALAKLPLPSRDKTSSGLARALALAGVASTLALLLNPYGIRAWTFPFTLFRRIGAGPSVFSRILEFAPPSVDPGDPVLRFFWILLAATVLSFAVPRVSHVTRLLGVLPFLALALMARRNIPLFAIAAAPVLAVNVTEIARALGSRLGDASRRRAGRVIHVAGPLLAGILGVAILRGASPALLGLPRERGLGVQAGLFPEEALATLDRLRIDGRIFHDLDFGGYIAWRDPQRKTFIDGRLEVVGPERLARFIEAHESAAAWERLRAEWNVEVLLLEHSSRGSAAFLRGLLASGEWTPVSLSPEAVLLVSRRLAPDSPADPRPGAGTWGAWLAESQGAAPGAGDALESLARPLDRWLRVRPSPAAVRRVVRYANLCMTLERVDVAREGYEAALAVAPDDPEALFNVGLCAMHEGRPDEARRIWEDALSRVERGSRPLFLRALAK